MSTENPNAHHWLSSTFDANTNKKVQALIEGDPEELEDRFYKNLAFGTGGMRGIMGIGTNRINKYTLGKNTQGISNYLKKVFPSEDLKAVIAYDCRHNSKEFAQIVADVFSANNIQVFLFSDLRPTPELSFAVKHLNCHCGIVLTASHNPPEYNGYKVYWQDGGQLVPPQDEAIIAEIDRLDFSEINFQANKNLIKIIDKEVDEAFIQASVENGSFQNSASAKDNLSIVFTSLHGTSITMVPKVLEEAGYTNVHLVKEQAEPDGDFPTVESPNPEEPEALKMALELADKKQADILIGTDPDCDRLGIAVRDLNNELILLNGNQTMLIMSWFLLEQWKKEGKITPANGEAVNNQFMGSTIVSTPMLRLLVEHYGVEYKQGLTGFKWIAKMIKDHPEMDFIGGGEESYGYMVGDFVRDKDAVTSTLLICEIAAQLKAEGSSVYQKLLELYVQYGLYKEGLISLVKKGKNGAKEIEDMMIELRENPRTEIDGEKVVLIEDYQNSSFRRLVENTEGKLDIPKSNVLIYYTENGTKIAARPSGTEPKIKFYVSVNSTLDSTEIFQATDQKLSEKIERIQKELKINV